MAREPEKPTAFGPTELKLLQSSLNGYSATIARALVYLDAKQEEELWVFKSASLETGLKCIRPFIDSLEQSLNAAAAGKPVTADTRKARKSKGS